MLFRFTQGFTTYAERRIVEAVQGEDRATLNIGIGWRGLVKEMERFKDNMAITKLKTNQEGIDPDDVFSRVPYEKGFQFLWRIEIQIGRPAFDEFLKKYIATCKFKSIDTDMFIDFLKANVPGIENEIDLKPVSNIYSKIVSLANEFKLGKLPREDEVADWKGQEWELYLQNLPKPGEASQFKSIDTDMFIDFLKANVPGIENEIDLKVWTEGTGIPSDAMDPVSNIYSKIVSLANEFKLGKLPREDEVADWKGQEWELYLQNLPKPGEASQISALDAQYRLSESKDYEVKVAFLELAILSRYWCLVSSPERSDLTNSLPSARHVMAHIALLYDISGAPSQSLFPLLGN
ncbi:unnamed protein product [Ilex paraguariensis]|uniref:Peptidase M1 leukotriene A4 hydrolase/aminopeptidase C-terminal domain-containing protein n=1 Tax=Ilex paraguariensis TaxID=185542 RepID=A0ABC8RF33_9AQUA